MTKIYVSAWREILARSLGQFALEQQVSPAWLINPTTKRPLKLDLFYPEIGLAVRFSGLRGQRRRGSSWREKVQQKTRDAARSDICEAHGISLADLNVIQSEPGELFNELELAMSRATRRLAKVETLTAAEKSSLLEQLKQARSELRALSRAIKTEKDLVTYLDLWRDRQFRQAETSAPPAPPAASLPPLAPGMAVAHRHFGPGVIQTVTSGGSDQDTLITIRFAHNEERTFMAGLLVGKLEIEP